MSGVQKTKLATEAMQQQVKALEAEGKAPHGEGSDIDGMTLTPILLIQRDMTGKSILLKDKGDYRQETTVEADVATFVEALKLDPMSKAYCRLLFKDDKGAMAFIIPGYTEEQWDAIEEDDDISLESLPPGTLSIIGERIRQLVDEKWEPEHDLQYTQGEMIAAALNYLEAARIEIITGKEYKAEPPLQDVVPWPWDMTWWKPAGVKRNIEKGGALICAQADAAYLNAQMEDMAQMTDAVQNGNLGGLLGALLSGLSGLSGGGNVNVTVVGPIPLNGEPKK